MSNIEDPNCQGGRLLHTSLFNYTILQPHGIVFND
jgi:hypothetical protein